MSRMFGVYPPPRSHTARIFIRLQRLQTHADTPADHRVLRQREGGSVSGRIRVVLRVVRHPESGRAGAVRETDLLRL